MKAANYIISSIFIMIGIVFVVLSGKFPSKISDAPGPGYFPMLLAIGLILLSLLIVFNNLKDKKEEKKISIFTQNNKRAYSVFLFVLIYATALEFLGYIISTLIMLIFLMSYMGNRKWIQKITISTAVTAAIYYVFAVLLSTPLPTLIN